MTARINPSPRPFRMTLRGSVGILAFAACLAGCASGYHPDLVRKELAELSAEETFAYLETHRPPTVSYIQYKLPFTYDVLNERFVYMNEQSTPYLIEMARDCKDLASEQYFSDMADVQTMRRLLRPGQDTIRGCQIRAIDKIEHVEETRTPDNGQSEATANGKSAPRTTGEQA